MPLKDKEQRKAYEKAYREANKERIKARREANRQQDKAYREAHKGRKKEYDNTRYQANKAQIKEEKKEHYEDRGRDQRIKKLTGDPTKDLRWYNGLLDTQGHVCAICHDVVEDATGKGQTLHVDHCHETGRARELLCRRCNTSLGGFREREDLLAAAIAYLQKHKRTPKPSISK